GDEPRGWDWWIPNDFQTRLRGQAYAPDRRAIACLGRRASGSIEPRRLSRLSRCETECQESWRDCSRHRQAPCRPPMPVHLYARLRPTLRGYEYLSGFLRGRDAALPPIGRVLDFHPSRRQTGNWEVRHTRIQKG